MKQHTENQNRSRKYQGSSSFEDAGQPSRAPRQDEDGQELVGSDRHQPGPADEQSSRQGISNRPANEEDAFPEPAATAEPAAPESVETDAKQLGGNRGRV